MGRRKEAGKRAVQVELLDEGAGSGSNRGSSGSSNSSRGGSSNGSLRQKTWQVKKRKKRRQAGGERQGRSIHVINEPLISHLPHLPVPRLRR